MRMCDSRFRTYPSNEYSCEYIPNSVWVSRNLNDRIRPKSERNNCERFGAHALHDLQFRRDGSRQSLDDRTKKYLLLW